MKYHKNPIAVTLKNLKIHNGIHTVIENGDLVIHQEEIIGLIGANGTGKSTILRAIMDEVELDGGEIILPKDSIIGYLSQAINLNEKMSVRENIKLGAEHICKWIEQLETLDPESPKRVKVEDNLTRHDGWSLDEKINDLIKNLGIPDREVEISKLSGGEKRRIALAQALVSNPDILILDEPTNHLDVASIAWLENFIKSFNGTCIVVTHDRYFLDKVVTRIIELDRSNFHSHNGNYSDYLISKAERNKVEANQEAKRQKFLKKEIEWVRSGVRARATKDRGRLDRYYDTLEIEGYTPIPEASILIPPPKQFSKRIIDLNNVSYEIGGKKIINKLNYDFPKRSRIGIIGPNGAGKTTFLKLLLKDIEPDTGKVIVGERTEFNYFDQAKLSLNENNTIFEEIGNGSDMIRFGEKSLSLRGYLKRFLFTDEKIKTEISHLSGGEKSRILLAKILKNGGNFIMLDEPTNDLDLDTLRILEETLIGFDGCVLVVSHDRYFLNRVCNKIFYLKGDGSIERYEGNYDDFVEGQKDRERRVQTGGFEPTQEQGTPSVPLAKREEAQEPIKSELTKEEKDELRKIERKISNAEGKVVRIEKEFADPDIYSNQKKVDELTQNLDKAKTRVSELYARWEELEGRS